MFVLFAHPLMAPLGGAADAVGSFGTLEQARKAAWVDGGDGRPVDQDVCEIWTGSMTFVCRWDGRSWTDEGLSGVRL